MIELEELYRRMTRLSQRYAKLKAIFDEFGRLAVSKLTTEECQVKDIAFLLQPERNCFDVSFLGKKVRFSFFVVRNEMHSLQGCVKCNPIGKDGEPLDTVVGDISFNQEAETSFKIPPDDDPLSIDTEWAAGYLVLRLLSDALDKK